MAQPTTVDVLIIGGGPAGLTAALTLARQRHSAGVFDSGSYRNARTTRLHMVPGWDNKAPADLRKVTRDDISRYPSIKFADIEVKNVKKNEDDHFVLVDTSDKNWIGKKLILATGSADVYPKIEGYEENWAIGIFHCLYCHGYEESGDDRTSGVLAVDWCANPAMAVHLSENAAQLTSSVTIYTNGAEELGQQILAASGDGKKPNIDTRSIKRIKKGPKGAEVVLEFEDGNKKTEVFLVHNPITHTKGPFAEQLGLELSPMGDIKADAPFHQTSVRGVFAAGDCVTPYKVTPGAFSSGCNAAVAASAQLQAEVLGHHSMV